MTERLLKDLKSECRINKNALIVEDDPNDAEFLRYVLVDLGFTASVSTNGNAAIELVRREPKRFGIIFVDIQLPDINGMQVLQCLYKISRELSIVVVTGGGRVETLGNTGYYGFVNKPVTTESMKEIISKTRSLMPA